MPTIASPLASATLGTISIFNGLSRLQQGLGAAMMVGAVPSLVA